MLIQIWVFVVPRKSVNLVSVIWQISLKEAAKMDSVVQFSAVASPMLDYARGCQACGPPLSGGIRSSGNQLITSNGLGTTLEIFGRRWRYAVKSRIVQIKQSNFLKSI
jgi:hypothetical protein